MSERGARVIDLVERRRRRSDARSRARPDAARDGARPSAHARASAGRSRDQRRVIELTASRALYEKLMLAKLLLSDEGDEATLADVVEVALEIWLGGFGRPPFR